jgi:transposase
MVKDTSKSWYDLSNLTEERRAQIIISDKLDGYSTSEICWKYDLTGEEVVSVIEAFRKKAFDNLDISAMYRKEQPWESLIQ